MKAISYSRYGGPEVLELGEVPEPKLGPDQVLVRVRAAAVNPVDWKVREGHLDAMLPAVFPVVPGWDVSGVVERTGGAVPEFAPGDEVIGYVREDFVSRGTFAEYVAAPVRTLAPKPPDLSFEEAAGLPLAGLTALQTLTKILGVRQGETVLVSAAAGGVGSLAVQIARHLGARVIGTASERNHDFVRRLGGEPVVYGEGLVDRVRALAPGGVDAAFDVIGGANLKEFAQLLAVHGRIASISDPSVTEYGGQYYFVRPDPAPAAPVRPGRRGSGLGARVGDVPAGAGGRGTPVERGGQHPGQDRGDRGLRACVTSGPGPRHRPPSDHHQDGRAHGQRDRAQRGRAGRDRGQGGRAGHRQVPHPRVGEDEEGQPQRRAQGAHHDTARRGPAGQGRPRGEHAGDGDRQGRTPPRQPRTLRLEPRVTLLAHGAQPSHPTSTTTAMATATTATTTASRAGKRDTGRSSPRRIARSTRTQWLTARNEHSTPVESRARARPTRQPHRRSGRNWSTAKPPPISASAVRSQARKVRSFASENR